MIGDEEPLPSGGTPGESLRSRLIAPAGGPREAAGCKPRVFPPKLYGPHQDLSRLDLREREGGAGVDDVLRQPAPFEALLARSLLLPFARRRSTTSESTTTTPASLL